MPLELRGVGKREDGLWHIHPTDLTLENGTMNVLLGPTLAGKTTMMRLMAGLDEPTAGRVFADGEDVTGVRVQDRRVAMVYQQFINYPSMTVYDNIASPLRLQGRDKAEIDRRVRQVAAMMKLTDQQLGRKPLELSGGQQQRCALARALVKEAGLVLLDEPLANLDYKLREELREEIPKIFEDSGAIFVYATTEPHEALLLGGKTICLWEGRVTQSGPTTEVYRQPADATTARVFSDPPMNFVTFDKRSGQISFSGAGAQMTDSDLSDLAEGAYTAGFRPNHLTVDRQSDRAIAFAVEVTGTEITGSESFVHVAYDGQRWVALAEGVRDISAGERRDVFVDPENLYIFNRDGSLARAAQTPAAH